MSFLFFFTKPGTEEALKIEVKTTYADLRLSYSRPGFLTYKSECEDNLESLSQKYFQNELIFAHGCGQSLGMLKEKSDSINLSNYHQFIDLVLEPDFTATKLTTHHSSAACDSAIKKVLIKVRNGEYWHGEYFRNAQNSRPWMDLYPPYLQPLEAPSRAYLKFKEATELFQVPFKAGDTVLELGAAPGGASFYYVSLGLKVRAVDPAELNNTVLSQPSLNHLKKQALQLTATECKNVNWICCDMNIDPEESLKAICKSIELSNYSVQGILTTFKLSEWERFLNLSKWDYGLKTLGFQLVAAKNLYFNKQEITAFYLRNSR